MTSKEKTVKDVFDEFTDEQKNVVYFMIGQALEDAGVKAGKQIRKRKDNLDYTRMVVCPLEGKKYFPEKGKKICPVCGREFKNPVGGPEHTVRMRKVNGHEIYFREGGFA